MHAKILTLPFALAVLVLMSSSSRAQEDPGKPKPPEQLKKLEPFVGTWVGKGTIEEPGWQKTSWQSQATSRWILDGFWLREDIVVRFEGNPQPVAARAYFGWDAENDRYVICSTYNDGEVRMDELELLSDGSTMLLAICRRPVTNAELTLCEVDGDEMRQNISVLMPDRSFAFSTGWCRRTDADPVDALDIGLADPPLCEEMRKLARGVGVYGVEGTMTMAPGTPPTKVTGTDTWTAIFGGAVLHGRSEGFAEVTTGKYVAESFWGWDPRRRRFTSFYISNLGEVGWMDTWAVGRSYVSTMAGTLMGQPMAYRFVLETDEAGRFTRGVGHTLMGTEDPFVSFEARYRTR